MTKAMLYRSEHVPGFGLVLAMPGATACQFLQGFRGYFGGVVVGCYWKLVPRGGII